MFPPLDFIIRNRDKELFLDLYENILIWCLDSDLNRLFFTLAKRPASKEYHSYLKELYEICVPYASRIKLKHNITKEPHNEDRIDEDKYYNTSYNYDSYLPDLF